MPLPGGRPLAPIVWKNEEQSALWMAGYNDDSPLPEA